VTLPEVFEAICPCIVAFIKTVHDPADGTAPHAPRIFGTGFLADPDGIVVTNRHVVEAFPTDPRTNRVAAAAMLCVSSRMARESMRWTRVDIKYAVSFETLSWGMKWFGEEHPDVAFAQLKVRQNPFLRLATEDHYVRTGMEIATAGFSLGDAALTLLGKLYDLRAESILDETAEELYEMAPCGYLTTTLNGRITRVNRTLAEWLGYEREELITGKRFVDLLTVGGRIFFETHFNLLLRVQDAVDEIALDVVRKDGRILPTLINARQKRDPHGEPLLNRFTIFNASERRLYERDLLAARDLLKTTLASIGDAVVVTDAEGRITFTNPVADVLCGWGSEFALGRSIDEVLVFYREDTGLNIENPIWAAVRSGRVVGLVDHTILASKDGRHLPVDNSASPVKDADGRVIGSVLVFRDISERRRAEKELENAYQQLKSSAAELQRSNEDLSQFAYVASHDLRSPLNTIGQFTELLEREYGVRLGDGKDL
jgi:PAS domain S-box-containing protein